MKVFIVALFSVVLCLVFKNLKGEYSLFLRIGFTFLILGVSLTIISPILSFIEELYSDTSFSGYVPTILKAIGIGMMSQITEDICKDCGENTIGERVGTFSKIEILSLSLPYMKELVTLCKELL